MEVGDIYKTKSCGPVVVVAYESSQRVTVEFIETKYRAVAYKKSVVDGLVRDKLHPRVSGTGYIGVGPYSASVGGVHTRAYNTWKGMLLRCYSEKCRDIHPTYKYCTVDERWHNFQNFAAWFQENLPEDSDTVDYHLDKDFKVQNNRVYSPETCAFIPGGLNTVIAHAKHWKFVSPTGEITEVYNLSQFCRDKSLSKCIMRKVHRGERTEYEGWTAYKEDSPSP